MEMWLKLRADGYHVGYVHSDRGHEFQGAFNGPEPEAYTCHELQVMT